MEITKVVKPFIRRGANTFGNIVYVLGTIKAIINIYIYFFKMFSSPKNEN